MPTASRSRPELGLLTRRALRALRSPREILTTVHAIAVLVVVETLVRWTPLPRLTRLFGLRLNLEPPHPDVERLALTELSPKARRQLRCTNRVADLWPLSKGPCLRRALVAGHLLRRRDPALRLGITGSTGDLRAHAWLEIEDRPLESVSDFKVFQRVPPRAAG